ncbi:MAG: ATP-binding cassette domain-containing protein [Oscillibacter sp.]|nr:ATP-binding cassette domain-containing protein [Oscillibacter sp.]
MKALSFTKTYGGKTVLDFPSRTFRTGRTCAVLGANGSGKTTLARILSLALPPDGGGPVWEIDPRIGYLPQRSYVFHMSVRQNLALGSGGPLSMDELVAALELGPLLQNRPRALSGGEAARVALARLLMGRYDLLILDEPTAAMDVRVTLAAESLITRYREATDCAVLWVTHQRKQALRVAEETLFFHGGRLIEEGETKALLTAPRQEETRRFLEFFDL